MISRLVQEKEFFQSAKEGHLDKIKTLIREGIDINLPELGTNATILHYASKNGHTHLVEWILTQENTNINLLDSLQRTALHWAVVGWHENIITLLVKKGINIHLRDDQDLLPIDLACMQGWKEMVKWLVCEGNADVNHSNKNGCTLLHQATRDAELAQWLILNHHANPHTTSYDNINILHRSCAMGNVELFEWLIKTYKMDYLQTCNGQSLLHIAIAYNHYNLAKLLITQYQLDIHLKDNDHQTPLHLAAHCNNINGMKLLLKKGANLNDVNKQGYLPVHLAAFQGNADIIEYLIKHNLVDVNITGGKLGYTPLHCAVTKNHIKAAQILIENGGADLNIQTIENKTAFDIAKSKHEVDKKYLPMINYLISTAQTIFFIPNYINKKDKQGNTLLHYACINRNLKGVRVLIENNAEVNVKDQKENTPIHIAAHHGSKNILKILLEKNAKNTLQQSNTDGFTPLHYASANGHLDIVKLFIYKHYCNIEKPNKDGLTALDLALKYQQREVVCFLLENGAGIKKNFNTINYQCYVTANTILIGATCNRIAIHHSSAICTKKNLMDTIKTKKPLDYLTLRRVVQWKLLMNPNDNELKEILNILTHFNSLKWACLFQIKLKKDEIEKSTIPVALKNEIEEIKQFEHHTNMSFNM